MAYYENLTPVDNTGDEACIYQIAGSKKGVWYVRIKRHNTKGYFRKTLKTTSFTEALKKANRYWLEVRDAESRDIVLTPSSNFAKLANKWIAEKRQRSNAVYFDRSIEYQFNNYYIPYFGNFSIEHITDKAYKDYLNNYRLLNPARKKPKLNTLTLEQSHLNSFLNWCYEKGYTRRRFQITKLKDKANRWIINSDLVDTQSKDRRDLATYKVYCFYRDWFDHVDGWEHPFIKEVPFHVLINRRRAAFYLKTLYNLCCRAGEELLKAKWGDLTKHPSEEKDGAYYITLQVRHGKKVRKNRFDGVNHLTYVSDYRYIKMLSSWKMFLEENGFPADRDAFLFPLKKGRQDSLGRRLREERGLPAETYTNWDSVAAGALIARERPRVLEWRRSKGVVSRELEEEIMGFTWYSARHVSIKRMLKHSKFPIHFVAEKANTGITMIQDFYWKYMEDPETRIVSRHRTISPDKREISVFDEEDISALDSIATKED